MYLKKIVAHGFKSFADNVTIELENKLVGIVGPNGSGKSNVVDAVRWVLGEQSVKSLRGDNSMTDVIFTGSKSRKPMNIASVTLIFDNSDHYFNSPYEEISIKRRLYKDGTNEYFLNQEKCRLKDLTDILLDSGIGKESFNIISQGKIEEILSNKPENRRVVFEEAANVLKYKKRKEEALRKLDKTHDNISRINDIINELELQVEPLKIQKEKAVLFINLQDELKELEISLIANDITEINDIYQDNKNKIDILKEKIVNTNISTTSNETKIEEYKLNLNKLDLEIKSTQSNLLDSTTNVEKLNSKKQIILERKKYEVDNKKLHDNIVELKESNFKLQNEVNRITNDINIKENELTGIINHISLLEKDINKLKDNKYNVELELSKNITKSTILKNKISSLNESIDSNSLLPYAVKNILSNPKLRGIHDIIGNLIDVDEKYSKAISTVIGANSSNVVVDNDISIKEAITYLKSANIGRVTFYPLNIIKPKKIDDITLNILNKSKGFINVADKLVKYDNKYSNIIKNLLGNVIVVDNIDNANIISKDINYKYRIVTIDSVLLHVGGSITGGTIKTRNIITEKYELDNNIKLLDKLVINIKNLEQSINDIDYNLKALEDKIYLQNKLKLELNEYIELRKNTVNSLNLKIDSIHNEIEGTANIINNKLSDEENKILNEYYSEIKNKDELTNKLNVLNNKKEKLSNLIDEEEYRIKKDNKVFLELNNELKNLEIETNRIDVKLDNLLNTLNETYNMTYEKAKSLYKLDIEVNIARTSINSLKRKIKDLGVVNITAPEEYEKVSVRYEFLIHQKEELNKAENTLLEIIQEMDLVMKREFINTFNTIKKNFSITFKELFRGGHAELILTDEKDILNTGIEIEACPPGKSLKSINLLSGGEKTFTAISLLFAILKSRPVPFCILDEVEAALDEVNVDAFLEYITKLKNKTQFILITHKKRTMEYADILYGITMQESGISKLVSVKLEEIK